MMIIPRSVKSPWIAFLFGVLFGASVVAVASPQRVQFEDSYQRQIITNTEAVHELRVELDELKKDFRNHEDQQFNFTEKWVSEERELQVTVAAHEKALWILIAAALGMLMKMLSDILSSKKSSNGNNGRPIYYNGRLQGNGGSDSPDKR